MRYAPLLYPLEDEHLIVGSRILGPFFISETEARKVAASEHAKAKGLPLVAWVVTVDGETITGKQRIDGGRTPNTGANTMDPDAVFTRWARAITADDMDEAEEAAGDLIGWINKGGFEPRQWKNPEMKRIFVRWVQDSMTTTGRQANPKKKMAKDDHASLVAALREFGAVVMKERGKLSKPEAVMGVVLASELDRKEVMKVVREALPAPKKAPPTEEEKKARLAKRMSSCEKLLAAREGKLAIPVPTEKPEKPAEPKKRGRKAKPEKPAEPKKKRGRPPKAHKEPAAPKRPRGRPRKAAPTIKIPVPAERPVEVEIKPTAAGTIEVEVTPPPTPAAPAPTPVVVEVPAPVVAPAAAPAARSDEEMMAMLMKAMDAAVAARRK